MTAPALLALLADRGVTLTLLEGGQLGVRPISALISATIGSA